MDSGNRMITQMREVATLEVVRPPDSEMDTEVMGHRRFSVSGETFDPIETFEAPVYPKTREQKLAIVNTLRRNILFKDIVPEVMNEIVNAMFQVSAGPSEVLITQGAQGDYFYIVESGLFHIFVRSETGEVKKVQECGPSMFFGELALMYNAPRAATVIAVEPSTVWAVDRFTFQSLIMHTALKKRILFESFLSNCPIFSSLSKYEISFIADELVGEAFESGDIIVKQGEIGEWFYLLEAGQAVCMARDEKHDEPLVVKVLNSGDYFGEISLLCHTPRAASVVARTMCKVVKLHSASFTRVLGPVEDILKGNIRDYLSYEDVLQGRPVPGRTEEGCVTGIPDCSGESAN